MRPGSTESRVMDLERQVAVLARQLDKDNLPRQRYFRSGAFKARLTSDLAQTTDPSAPQSATFRSIEFDGTNIIYYGRELTCYDYMLTGGTSLPSGTHVWVAMGRD